MEVKVEIHNYDDDLAVVVTGVVVMLVFEAAKVLEQVVLVQLYSYLIVIDVDYEHVYDLALVQAVAIYDDVVAKKHEAAIVHFDDSRMDLKVQVYKAIKKEILLEVGDYVIVDIVLVNFMNYETLEIIAD